jgi:hypothetical protein
VTRIRTGEALALAAILVSLPRHGVAQLHQAGMAVPSAPWWAAVVGVSAVAWGLLEALTLAHLQRAYTQTRKRGLVTLTVVILATIATVNAPSLVADSAGLTLTGLLGVASITHWVWAGASILSTLLVVVAAFAADAATAQAATAALVDALDSRRSETALAVAGASVTVNVGQTAAGATESGGRLSEGGHVAIAGPQTTETRVLEALAKGPRPSKLIAAELGLSDSAVRMTDAWAQRVKGASR